MRRHFYEKKKVCSSITGIKLTDEIRTIVLQDRIYHPPPKESLTKKTIVNNINNIQNIQQINLNNFNNLQVHEKLSAYLAYKNVEPIDLSTKVLSMFEDLRKKIQKDDNHARYIELEITTTYLMSMIDLVCKVHEDDLRDFCVCMNKLYNTISIYEGSWDTSISSIGASKIVRDIQGAVLECYEKLLINRIYYTKNAQVRQKCTTLLKELYIFLAAFDLKPYVYEKCNAYIVDDNNLNSYAISDEYMALYNRLCTTKTAVKNQIKNDVVNIVSNSTKANVSKLDKNIAPIKYDVCRQATGLYPNEFERNSISITSEAC